MRLGKRYVHVCYERMNAYCSLVYDYVVLWYNVCLYTSKYTLAPEYLVIDNRRKSWDNMTVQPTRIFCKYALNNLSYLPPLQYYRRTNDFVSS